VQQTLPDRRPVPEDRAPESDLCRAVSDRGLEVTTHPRRDDIGFRVVPAYLAGDLSQPGERSVGVRIERGNSHHPAQGQAGCSGDRGGNLGHLLGLGTAAARLVVEADLHQAAEPTIGGPERSGCAAQCPGQFEAVHRLDDVGVPGDRARLVRLQLTDEMPDQPGARQCCRLRLCLLVAVLANVPDTKVDEHSDVVGREGLGDHHQINRTSITAGRQLCCSDALAGSRQTGCDRVSSRLGDHALLQEVRNIQVVTGRVIEDDGARGLPFRQLDVPVVARICGTIGGARHIGAGFDGRR
jgi:hypothetical protein